MSDPINGRKMMTMNQMAFANPPMSFRRKMSTEIEISSQNHEIQTKMMKNVQMTFRNGWSVKSTEPSSVGCGERSARAAARRRVSGRNGATLSTPMQGE